MDSSEAPTEQLPTAGHRLPSPHNNQLTTDKEGEWGERQGKGTQVRSLIEKTWRPDWKYNMARRTKMARYFFTCHLFRFHIMEIWSAIWVKFIVYTDWMNIFPSFPSETSWPPYANELTNGCHHLRTANWTHLIQRQKMFKFLRELWPPLVFVKALPLFPSPFSAPATPVCSLPPTPTLGSIASNGHALSRLT